jgi:hypothetical protein
MQTLKSLFMTLLILGGAFLAYDYYLAPDADKMVFKKPAAKPLTESPVAPVPSAPPPEEAVRTATPIVATSSAPLASIVPAPVPATAINPAPSKLDGFVPPTIPDVESATVNWTRIPPSAFPRPAKLSKAVSFKSSFGATEVRAGTEVTVMGAQDKILTVAPNAQSSLRGTVELESTDLQATLTQVYESWRAKRIEAARQSWQHRNESAAAPESSVPASDDKPEMGSDGTYPLLIASMKAGDVTEITPANIVRWGQPVRGEHQAQPCWDILVDFNAQTAFGKISSSAVAKVVRGRVVGWFYKGSGESVP